MDYDLDLQLLRTVVSVLVFVLGAMLGSFLNVCVYRLPRNESVVRPRSKCPKCGNAIAWYDNVPVVSWLVLGAKCRQCSEPISWQYPLVEALTGSLFLAVFWKFGFSIASPVYMALAAGLVLITFVDLTDWTIPDEVTIPGMPIGIVCALAAMAVPNTRLLLDNVYLSLAGLVLGGGILYLLDKISLLLLKKRGMGFGDVKLMAMLGAFFGPLGVFLIIMMASLLGSVVGISMILMQRNRPDDTGGHYLPFGPYIALGGVLYLFIGPEIVQAYLAQFQAPPPVMLGM